MKYQENTPEIEPSAPSTRRREYIVTSETYQDEHGARMGYGIAAMERDDDIMTILAHAPDISPDAEAVRALARQCTGQQLDPIHLEDVVDDFLAVH